MASVYEKQIRQLEKKYRLLAEDADRHGEDRKWLHYIGKQNGLREALEVLADVHPDFVAIYTEDEEEVYF